MQLRVRSAREDDLLLIFNWANEPLTRKMSFNQEFIPLETHKIWFHKVLSSQTMRLLVVEGLKSEKWQPVAQVRFNKDGEVSMSLAAEFRGQRLATPVIKAAMEYVMHELPIGSTLVAHIKHENTASSRAFERAGFQFARETTIKGYPCLEYVYKPQSGSDSI